MKHLFALLLMSAMKILNAAAQQMPTSNWPVVIHECDIVAAYNIKSCGEWHLNATGNYSGEWPDGSRANLTVLRFSQTEIVLKRQDVTGANASLQGEYRAGIQDGRIDGTFSIHKAGLSFSGVWKGTFDGSATSTPAAISEQTKQQNSTGQTLNPTPQTAMIRSSVPLQITECEGSNCSMRGSDIVTWAFNGKNGTGIFSTGNQPLTIEQMDNGVIVVRRTDTVGPWLGSAVYTGRIEGAQITGSVQYFDRGNGTPRTDRSPPILSSLQCRLPMTRPLTTSWDRIGIAGPSDSVPLNPSEANSVQVELWKVGIRYQIICQGLGEQKIMRELTPEREVKGAFFGELHKDAVNGVTGAIYSCIGDLGSTPDNSMLDEIAGAIQGGMMSKWTYTTYLYDKDEMVLTERASVGEEAVKRATDFAVDLAAAKAAQRRE